MTIRPGDFWLASVPYTDGSGAKIRPILVLWLDGQDAIVATVTSAAPRTSTDILLNDWQAGGRSRITPDDYIEGPPELIVEIAASSAAYDLREKKTVYQRNGVLEYMIWQIYEQRLDWFYLHEDEYESLLPDTDGIIHSRVFPGLHLDAPALLAGDLARVLATLQLGLTADEHATFIERIRAI